ncbi:nickel transporter permease [Arachnia propionica]|jgi:putative permease, nickel or dipeptide transport|uniref:nickel transporter permease n=1 Tax=Arachnia propionica TaxID=1750 RepID=UPI000F6E40B3|nr:nickel transporter permease [Arachnia propionica]VEJ57186.1 Glutathione transport system permease protein gsiD [Arachnia propionica]
MSTGKRIVMIAVAVFLVLLIIGPWIAPQDPNLTATADKLQGPSAAHWFGTDDLGRDVFSRILTGGLTTVGLSALALGISILIGVPLGLLSGYLGGRTDWALMRAVDIFLALPEYIVAMIIAGLMGQGFGNLLLAILIIKWVGYTRLARSVVMQEKAKDYLMVSTISGASTLSIMRRHLLPHIVGPVMALATVDIGKVILLVASLSYLGLGVQLPSAEWGAMLNEAQTFFTQAPHLMLAPGLAIFLVVCAANWLGDQLQSLYAISGERKEETGVAA